MEAAAPDVYTYLVPPEFSEEAQVGQAVLAPLGRRETVGYIMTLKRERADASRLARLKPLAAILAPEPLFGPSLARLVDFISSYYFYPPGLCAKEILPGGLSPKIENFVALKVEAQVRTILGEEAELTDRLREAGEMGLSLAALEKEGFGAALKKMAAAGHIRRSARLAGKNSRLSFEWWIGPADKLPDSPPRLGPKAREMWELLMGGPPKPLSYYASYINDALSKARALEAKGLAVLTRREIFRDDPGRAIFQDRRDAHEPTPQQAAALSEIFYGLNSKAYSPFLLYGVTGSGKTEVYIRAALETLAEGREVLWLAPEIGLTMGLEGLLRNRLGTDRVAVLHSGLTAAQRHDQWLRIRRGLAPVVLGARSAVFAPLENLGLVVVDEEHDWAYKQDDGLRYNGRDLAVWRAREAGAALILGSATPSLESFHGALSGRYKLLTMKKRPGTALLPEIKLISQAEEPARLRRVLAPGLRRELAATLARGEQALLFVNRRGMANLPMCLACGEVLKCPHCSRTLTLHGRGAANTSQNENSSEATACFSIEDSEVLVCHRLPEMPFAPLPLFRRGHGKAGPYG